MLELFIQTRASSCRTCHHRISLRNSVEFVQRGKLPFFQFQTRLIFATECYAEVRTMPSIMRCPSVMFVYFVKTYSQIFFTIRVPHHSRFSILNVMAIFQWGPFNWGKNRDFRPVAGFGIDHCWTIACLLHFNGGISSLNQKTNVS